MAPESCLRWIYSRQELDQTPSRKDGIDIDKELQYRQQAANLIQDMGQRLAVNQLTINTAIVYMHRFYVYHSFTVYNRYAIAPTALFLAAKVEEQPKKLEHVLKICHACLHPEKMPLDTHSDAYLKQAQELVQNELVLLQTLGFEISVDHPHTHVVKCTQLVKASRDLSQMAYFMATNSLHLTTFCLLYKPTVVAAMCIHLSCKWSNYEVPLSSDGKAYWAYMDSSITEPLLNTIVNEFLKILNRCPTRLRKLKNYRPSKEGEGSGTVNKDAKVPHQQIIAKANPPALGMRSTGPAAPAVPQEQANASSQSSKEKRQLLSFEEYSRRTKQQANNKPVQPAQQQLPKSRPNLSGQMKPPSSHSQVPSTSNIDQSRQPRPHFIDPSSQHVKIEQKPHISNYPNQKLPPTAASQDRSKTLSVQQQAPTTLVKQQKQQLPKAGLVDEDVAAISRDIEGRIQTEKLRNAAEVKSQPSDATDESRQHSKQRDHPSRHAEQHHRSSYSDKHLKDHSTSKAHPSKEHTLSKERRNMDSKTLVNMYRRDPDKLRHLLKYKAQVTSLTNEEKLLLKRLMDKRKEQEAARLKLGASKDVMSPGLTLRIKIPEDTSASASNSTIAKIGASSSGSGSDNSPSVRAARKRGHGDPTSDHSSKHSRRSESDHSSRHQHNHSSTSGGGGNGATSNSSGLSKSRHSSSSHHRHLSSRSGSKHRPHHDVCSDMTSSSKIESISKVAIVPPVTVSTSNSKKTNGSQQIQPPMPSSYPSRIFDPNQPIPAQVPDDIFDTDSAISTLSLPFSQGSGNFAESAVSTPESGELHEDTPPLTKLPSSRKRKGYAKSPSGGDSGNVEPKRTRAPSSFGYHSGSEGDCSLPPLIQKPSI